MKRINNDRNVAKPNSTQLTTLSEGQLRRITAGVSKIISIINSIGL
jgi:hypothetical protein